MINRSGSAPGAVSYAAGSGTFRYVVIWYSFL